MKMTVSALFFIVFFYNVNAQYKYWISFRDKANVTFNPVSYFDKRAIMQKLEHNLLGQIVE